jgi:hypothetical protein
MGGAFLALPEPAAAEPVPCYVIAGDICREGGDPFAIRQICFTSCGTTEFVCLNDNTVKCGGDETR